MRCLWSAFSFLLCFNHPLTQHIFIEHPLCESAVLDTNGCRQGLVVKVEGQIIAMQCDQDTHWGPWRSWGAQGGVAQPGLGFKKQFLEDMPTKLRPNVGREAREEPVKQPRGERSLAGPCRNCRKFRLCVPGGWAWPDEAWRAQQPRCPNCRPCLPVKPSPRAALRLGRGSGCALCLCGVQQPSLPPLPARECSDTGSGSGSFLVLSSTMPTGEATPRESGLARARQTDSDLLLGRGLPVPIPKPGGGRVSHWGGETGCA